MGGSAKAVREWLKAYEYKLVVAGGLILVAVISFEVGYLNGQRQHTEPFIVERVPDNFQFTKVTTQAVPEMPKESLAAGTNQRTEATNDDNETASGKTINNCAFVGSKNSDKYHPADCRWAEQIKPENRICFSSKEEAESRGYQSSKGCD